MKRNLECQANLEVLSGFEKEWLLGLLLNDSPDVIVFVATDFTLRMVNRSFTQHTGLSADEVIGSSGSTLFPGLNKRLTYLLQKSRLTKQPAVSKANLQLPASGTAVWQATVNPLLEAGGFNGWLLIFKKITMLNSADWEAVADQLTEGLMVLDRSGQVMVINQKAVDLLGVSPDSSFSGGADDDCAPLYQLYTTDGTEIAPQDWPHLRVLRGESVEHFEAELRITDQAEVKRLSFRGTTLHDRENQSAFVVLTCSDRTQEQQLSRANQQLQAQETQHIEVIRRLTGATAQLDGGLTQLYDAT